MGFIRYLFFILITLYSCSTSATNRLATSTDINTVYAEAFVGSGLTMEVNDFIVDDTNDGDAVNYFFFTGGSEFPGFREGGTIWIDGTRLGTAHYIRFQNGVSGTWAITTATIRPIPGTRVVVDPISTTPNIGFRLSVGGLKHPKILGSSTAYPGHATWANDRKFATGYYGFYLSAGVFVDNGHAINIDIRENGGTIEVEGFEAFMGFSGLRINSESSTIQIASIDVYNYYAHDLGEGEPIYIGRTAADNHSRIFGLKIKNVLIARAGAECIQVQDLNGDILGISKGSCDITNTVSVASDMRWMNNFQGNQDTGLQWVVAKGINRFRNSIIDGVWATGLMRFGSSQFDGMTEGSRSEIDNVLVCDWSDTGIYLHNSATSGVHWYYTDVRFIDYNGIYHDRTDPAGTLGAKPNYIVSSKLGTDDITFVNLTHDGTIANHFQSTTGITISGSATDATLPKPEYVNSGAHEPFHSWSIWTPTMGTYHPIDTDGNGSGVIIYVPFAAGDIVTDMEEGFGFYGTFKCILTHTCNVSSARPHLDATRWVEITWDKNGTRSDQPGWISGGTQSKIPPDDLRLKQGSYWKNKGMGLTTPSPKKRR